MKHLTVITAGIENVLSHVWLCATPWTVARLAPLPMGFPRQEYWSGLPFPLPGNLSNPGIKPLSPASPKLQVDSFTAEPPWKFQNRECRLAFTLCQILPHVTTLWGPCSYSCLHRWGAKAQSREVTCLRLQSSWVGGTGFPTRLFDAKFLLLTHYALLLSLLCNLHKEKLDVRIFTQLLIFWSLD